MKFRDIILYLNEFDYRKNGLELTAEFLEMMLEEVERLIDKKKKKNLKMGIYLRKESRFQIPENNEIYNEINLVEIGKEKKS